MKPGPTEGALQQGIHVQLLETGQTQTMPLPPGVQTGEAFWEFDGWYPDSTRFVADVAIPEKPVSLLSVPVLGGTPHELAEDGRARVSADGSTVAFLKVQGVWGPREVWLMGSRQEATRSILCLLIRPPGHLRKESSWAEKWSNGKYQFPPYPLLSASEFLVSTARTHNGLIV